MIRLDNALWVIGIVLGAAVFGLLLYRRVWRTLPIFCVYCAWSSVSSVAAYVVMQSFPSEYTTAYLSEMAVDSVLQFCVLVELAWSVLRPLRASLPRRTPVVLGAIVLAVGAAIWPLVVFPGLGKMTPDWRILLHLQESTSILRILMFLLLAGCSQLLSIGWRDRELQVATGFGFYSLVSLSVTMIRMHHSMRSLYNTLEELLVAVGIGTLVYWVVVFSQKEAERREFTPQMQSFLLAVAGSARTARVALDSSATKSQKRLEP